MFSFFKRYDVHLSPEVHGRITLNDEPMANLEIFRELHYGKEYLDNTLTDAEGEFYFPEKIIKSSIPGKPFDETRTIQVITVDYENRVYLLWHTATGSTEPRKVLVERLRRLDCDLGNTEIMQHFQMHENPSFEHHIGGICRWTD